MKDKIDLASQVRRVNAKVVGGLLLLLVACGLVLWDRYTARMLPKPQPFLAGDLRVVVDTAGSPTSGNASAGQEHDASGCAKFGLSAAECAATTSAARLSDKKTKKAAASPTVPAADDGSVSTRAPPPVRQNKQAPLAMMMASPLRSKVQDHDGNDYVAQTDAEPLLKKRVAAPPVQVREYLRDVVVMHMMSPTRYNLAPLMYRHYEPYFGTRQIFAGPKNATVPDVDNSTSKRVFAIEGHDVVRGTMQYVALAAIIRRVEALSPEERAAQGLPRDVAGYLFIGDDLILQPWMLHGRNKNVAWCAGMGIANAQNWRPVKPVNAMSAEPRFTRRNVKKWPFWFSARAKLVQGILPEVDAQARANLALAAELTPASVFRESGYTDPDQQLCCSKEFKDWHVFYAIVDAFYVPTKGGAALRWANYSDVCRKHWLHLETAIPTTLRMVSPTYEVLRVQYYWSVVSAQACLRRHWSLNLDGFHRCRHDHAFIEQLFSNLTHAERVLALDTYGVPFPKNAAAQKVAEMRALQFIDKSWNPAAYDERTPLEFDDRLPGNKKSGK